MTAVALRNGKVSMNSDYCWIDAQVFLNLAKENP